MKEERQHKVEASRVIQSQGNKGNLSFVDNRPQSIIQAKLLNAIQQRRNYMTVQRKFSGDIETAYWNKAIEYIGTSSKAYATLAGATEDIEIIEKKDNLSTTTTDDNSFCQKDADDKGEIKWNPLTNLFFGKTKEETKGKVSPASVLYHEMGHATQWLSNKALFGQLLGLTVRRSEGIEERVIEIHNLANNEIPFNKEKHEPVRNNYKDANIESDNTPGEVSAHTLIETEKYKENTFIDNYNGLSLEEVKAWMIVDNAVSFLNFDQLIEIMPLIEHNDNRRTHLIKKLKELKELKSIEKFKISKFNTEFADGKNKTMYDVLVAVGLGTDLEKPK